MTAARVIGVELPGAAYDITIEPGLLQRLGGSVRRVAPCDRALLAVDKKIAGDHGETARASLEAAGIAATVVELVAHERHKTLDTVARLYDAMLGARLDRQCAVVAVGGGIVGDVAGFAAATYMRGVPLVHVPTTLLAMVDASIGGKTGVNVVLPGGGLGKNMVGAFWQPRAVLVDSQVLSTLEARDFRCGLAECVKHALIADASLLDDLVNHAMEHDALIERCARIKVDIVQTDEREAGRRALLNLGHTFAHALESRQELELRHGEAVAIGLAAAAACAAQTGRLDQAGHQRIHDALEGLGLPREVPAPVEVSELMEAMQYDKKATGGRLRLVLPVGIGSAEVVDDVHTEVINSAWGAVGAT